MRGVSKMLDVGGPNHLLGTNITDPCSYPLKCHVPRGFAVVKSHRLPYPTSHVQPAMGLKRRTWHTQIIFVARVIQLVALVLLVARIKMEAVEEEEAVEEVEEEVGDVEEDAMEEEEVVVEEAAEEVEEDVPVEGVNPAVKVVYAEGFQVKDPVTPLASLQWYSLHMLLSCQNLDAFLPQSFLPSVPMVVPWHPSGEQVCTVSLPDLAIPATTAVALGSSTSATLLCGVAIIQPVIHAIEAVALPLEVIVEDAVARVGVPAGTSDSKPLLLSNLIHTLIPENCLQKKRIVHSNQLN
jgi:hypothetical protein